MAAELFIHTLGHPELRDAAGSPAGELRRKDLALLAYLAVEGARTHPRPRLAALLWGDSLERQALHSLTQALRRVQAALGVEALSIEKKQVRWHAAVPSDAAVLLQDDPWHPRLDDALALYADHFLAGFDAGRGADEFMEWSDRTRAALRNAALRLLEARGEDAEAAREWDRALRIGDREVGIDPLGEQGHRRVMRALRARGEPNRALRHFRSFEAWLAAEIGGEPDRDTRALAEQIAAEAEERPATSAPSAPDEPAWYPREHTMAAFSPPADDPPADEPPGGVAERDASPPRGRWPRPPDRPGPRGRPRGRRRRVVVVVFVFLMLMALVSPGVYWRGMDALKRGTEAVARGGRREPPPGWGESIQLRKAKGTYLVFNKTLYEYPDSATQARCLGPFPGRVRRVARLPDYPVRMLASVRTHPWQGGTGPVLTDDPVAPTQHVSVGCVLSPVATPADFEAIFGVRAWSRAVTESDRVLSEAPSIRQARPYPVRAAGTLLRGTNDSIRWVIYHGGALRVPSPRVLKSYCRSPDEAVPVPDDEFRYYRAWADLPVSDPPCAPAAPPRARGVKGATE